jgi:hypothetical protein
VVQSEHLSLVVGSGFSTGIAAADGKSSLGMGLEHFGCVHADKVDAQAKKTAEAMGRGDANVEDQLRAALALYEGLRIINNTEAQSWKAAINSVLKKILIGVLEAERGIGEALSKRESKGLPLLLGFLMSFASRAATRERLNIFTTNYDRLVEHGCDLLGLRIIDRFVGSLYPEFRSSRQSIDFHYNPPGIRGEPRYLEGVVRLTKLHGSVDWVFDHGGLRRCGLPFGAIGSHSEIPTDPFERTMIYPNPAKDVETLFFPYAELFRDFASAICQPNSALVTFGYGFGDDHINRVIRDMLTIPSTHLVTISRDTAGGRIKTFCDSVGRDSQVSLLIGKHFGGLPTLVENYLPKPAIDLITARRTVLLSRRGQEWSTASDDGTVQGDPADV